MLRIALITILLTACGTDDHAETQPQPVSPCDEIPHFYMTGENPLTCAELRELMGDNDND